ncbi:hypothetical protein ACFOM8_18465 [Paracoccus angustae]|uniref:Uncharacterized protein n=1 Tax=Paracoccus angustae TaxID=1671480 RepID=A0ABV7U8Y3_9RHOB
MTEEVTDIGQRRLQPIQSEFRVPALGQDGWPSVVPDSGKSKDSGGFRIDFQINRQATVQK